MASLDRLRFTLFQARRPEDPMRPHELECFARTLPAEAERIRAFDLLRESFGPETIAGTDVFLFGGSGDFSVVTGGDWLDRALGVMRRVHASGRPTFASCWGFQALARAMGGTVVHDRDRAEVGTYEAFLTDDGRADPVFSPLGTAFRAQMGHEDHVVDLPPNTTLMASSALNPNQAYRFDDAPIYCTQFHPELGPDDLRLRFAAYPRYLETIPGVSPESVERGLAESPESAALLRRFLETVA